MEAAYAEVFRANYERLVRGCTLAAGGDQGLAEDAVVEAFLRTHARWRRGQVDDVARYLQVAAVNEVRRLQRRRGRTLGSAGPELVPGSARPSAIGSVDQVAVRVDLAALLADLSDDERQVLVLRHYFDQRESDVAATLGLPVGTVKSLAHRARRRLQADARAEARATAPRPPGADDA